ncbi:uncharacterized protein [Asterias amurensis]|uniref:uncharacterized protein n=1 Tax=Asterias amurensis TaxID=7602 RepID=UPI003AB1C9ED
MTFNVICLAFAMLLVASIVMKAGALVCYVGDEANSIKGEPPLKLLPDQNPCECTEFRPGGVNTKRQAKPREVTFGNDGHPEGWTDQDCIKEMQTSGNITSPCATYSLQRYQGLNISPLGVSSQPYPVTLEFTLQSLDNNDVVEIDSINIDNIILCHFELDSFAEQMRNKNNFRTTQTVDFQDAFTGSTYYWLTINQYKIEFGRLGETSALKYQSMSEKMNGVSIYTLYGTTVVFYGTCPAEVESVEFQ